jgi:hypothetical protein
VSATEENDGVRAQSAPSENEEHLSRTDGTGEAVKNDFALGVTGGGDRLGDRGNGREHAADRLAIGETATLSSDSEVLEGNCTGGKSASDWEKGEK